MAYDLNQNAKVKVLTDYWNFLTSKTFNFNKQKRNAVCYTKKISNHWFCNRKRLGLYYRFARFTWNLTNVKLSMSEEKACSSLTVNRTDGQTAQIRFLRLIKLAKLRLPIGAELMQYNDFKSLSNKWRKIAKILVFPSDLVFSYSWIVLDHSEIFYLGRLIPIIYFHSQTLENIRLLLQSPIEHSEERLVVDWIWWELFSLHKSSFSNIVEFSQDWKLQSPVIHIFQRFCWPR